MSNGPLYVGWLCCLVLQAAVGKRTTTTVDRGAQLAANTLGWFWSGDLCSYEARQFNLSREFEFQFRRNSMALAHCADTFAEALGACILSSEYL